jgi:hypothetical protein
MPFSAGLGMNSETDTYLGSTYNGKVTVTTHSMADNMHMNDYRTQVSTRYHT